MKTYRTIQLLAAGLGLYSGSASALQTGSVRLYDMGDSEFTMAEYQAAQTSHFQTDKRPLANSHEHFLDGMLAL